MKFWNQKLNILKGIISGFIVVILLVVAYNPQYVEPEKADAFACPQCSTFVQQLVSYVAEYGTYVQSAITSAAAGETAVSTGALATKEFIMDAIVWPLINAIISNMIRDITQWVNSGFQGKPAFATDLGGFMTDIADRVAGDFIYTRTTLAGLCSPFNLNASLGLNLNFSIQTALDLQYRGSRGFASQCTLSGAVGNMKNFFNGNFLQGGWNGWFQMTLVPSNNPYGAMFEAENALNAQIAGAQFIEKTKLDFGRGFFSLQSCTGDPGNADEVCTTQTPGVVIESQLNAALGIPAQRLAYADEINELISALFSQIAKQAIGGVGGLLGMTQNNSSGQNYFDQVSAQRAPAVGSVTTGNDTIQNSVTKETRYLTTQQQIINMITDASTYEQRIHGATTPIGALTSSLSGQLASAQAGKQSSTATLASLNTLLADYKAIRDPNTPLATLELLLTKYGATSAPEAEYQLMKEYTSYLASGNIHDTSLSVSIELQTIPNLQKEIQAFFDAINLAYQDDNSSNNSSDGGD